MRAKARTENRSSFTHVCHTTHRHSREGGNPHLRMEKGRANVTAQHHQSQLATARRRDAFFNGQLFCFSAAEHARQPTLLVPSGFASQVESSSGSRYWSAGCLVAAPAQCRQIKGMSEGCLR